MKALSTVAKVLLTSAVVLVAVAVVAVKYWDYIVNPWTRDGQVRAQVVQITPRISGPIVRLPIEDNQFVKAGDLLFEIDPRTFAADLALAKAKLDRTRDQISALEKNVTAAEATVEQYGALIKAAEATIRKNEAEVERTKIDVDRAEILLKQGNVTKRRRDEAIADFDSAVGARDNAVENRNQARAQKLQAEADLAEAQADLGAPGEDNARLRAAKAEVETAELNLEFTKVVAPVDGYVTNLDLRLGDQAVTNKPALALVDVDSFWVHGFFKENYIEGIRAGDRAIVTLMSYPDKPLQGRVHSLGWGIAQADGSAGYELLPNVSPTFEWIRLAQRVPVRVHIDELPEGVDLRVGTTASVLVMTGTAGTDSDGSVPAAPRPLQ
ncbi:MAG: HlyD family secretion protein [Kiloniellales bacterium]|nr:HlyD family secretion protein [Kiloniellales bacterium]